jgi:cytochrome oxidase Cu insertion factor (SCO1/SenC/PrrC family)
MSDQATTAPRKSRTTLLVGILAVALAGIVAAVVWRGRNAGVIFLPVLFDAPPFSLIDQNGRPVTDQTLRGHPYVAAFIFTSCAGPCPMMSAHMARLQTTIAAPQVKLVSFTVDPERDTPQVLNQYAERFKADESRWFFLTGPKQTVMETIRGFKLTAEPAADGSGEILHDTRFLLVDPQGRIRGIYSSNDPAEMGRLPGDAERLAGQARGPGW